MLAVQLRVLLLCICIAAAACKDEVLDLQQKLADIDRNYLAPEVHKAGEDREKCAGVWMDQAATLKGEWVRLLCRRPRRHDMVYELITVKPLQLS